ncbi:MAG TPA: sugar phosphate nucleotidyltransferase [Lacunisphaera sp.]|nr:sugar phosphate nucleotidyltransferase [Lacunisphaera sp.]
MKVLILCGGRGIIDPETRQRIPKAMVQIGGKPVLWHVMKTFATAGMTDFTLALGEGGETIRRYFYYQHLESRDIEFHGASGDVRYLTSSPEEKWSVKCVDTGINAATGSRIARCRRYFEGETFMVSYSDCLCSVDLAALAEAHRAGGRIVTVTGVQPPSRFGTFKVSDDGVVGYTTETKLIGRGGYLNGGFMVMNPGIYSHLDVFNECSLELEVFTALARARQVAVFPHEGYWQAIDTERDIQVVSRLIAENKRPWLPAATG